MSSPYTPPTGPSGPHEPSEDGSRAEGPQEYAPAYGSAKPREGTSVKTAILLIGVAALIGLLVLGALLWAITRTVPTLFGGGEEDPPAPPPTTAVAQPTQEREPTTSPSAAASSAPTRGETTEPERPVAQGGSLQAPTGDPLFSKEGEFTETVLEESDEIAIEVPDHDGPLLITWSVTSDRESGGVFLNAHESKSGEMTEHMGSVSDGQTGMWLIDADPDEPKTTVIYPQGNGDTQWKVQGFPVSEVPRVERGAEVTGSGPGVFAVPAGDEQDYRFTSEEGVPRVEVYDADDLSSWHQFEYGTGPVELDVTAGSSDQILMVHADGGWTLEPRNGWF